MSYINQISLATNQEFINRVQQALVDSAIDVMAEAGATPGHSSRAAFAQAVLHDPQGQAKKVVYGIVTNEAITAASLDSDIQFTVNSMWDAYAGVTEAAG